MVDLQLLRHATFAINEREEKRVQAVLASKDIKDFDGHYFFNREYWYQRVRMTARDPDDSKRPNARLARGGSICAGSGGETY